MHSIEIFYLRDLPPHYFHKNYSTTTLTVHFENIDCYIPLYIYGGWLVIYIRHTGNNNIINKKTDLETVNACKLHESREKVSKNYGANRMEP